MSRRTTNQSRLTGVLVSTGALPDLPTRLIRWLGIREESLDASACCLAVGAVGLWALLGCGGHPGARPASPDASGTVPAGDASARVASDAGTSPDDSSVQPPVDAQASETGRAPDGQSAVDSSSCQHSVSRTFGLSQVAYFHCDQQKDVSVLEQAGQSWVLIQDPSAASATMYAIAADGSEREWTVSRKLPGVLTLSRDSFPYVALIEKAGISLVRGLPDAISEESVTLTAQPQAFAVGPDSVAWVTSAPVASGYSLQVSQAPTLADAPTGFEFTSPWARPGRLYFQDGEAEIVAVSESQWWRVGRASMVSLGFLPGNIAGDWLVDNDQPLSVVNHSFECVFGQPIFLSVGGVDSAFLASQLAEELSMPAAAAEAASKGTTMSEAYQPAPILELPEPTYQGCPYTSSIGMLCTQTPVPVPIQEESVPATRLMRDTQGTPWIALVHGVTSGTCGLSSYYYGGEQPACSAYRSWDRVKLELVVRRLALPSTVHKIDLGTYGTTKPTVSLNADGKAATVAILVNDSELGTSLTLWRIDLDLL